MSFFEIPPPPPEPDEAERGEPDVPEWFGPPSDVLPAAVPIRLVLARTETVVVAITDASAYPNGVSLTLLSRYRPGTRSSHGDTEFFGGPFGGHRFRRGSAEISAEILRFGVEYSDGRKATTIGLSPGWGGNDSCPDIALVDGGGGGNGHHWDCSFWLWPLPPPGKVAFVVEWPAEGIQLTRHDVDAGLFREASEQAEELWSAHSRVLRGPESHTQSFTIRAYTGGDDEPDDEPGSVRDAPPPRL